MNDTTQKEMTIIDALRTAIDALKTLSEKDFKTEERKAFAHKAFETINRAEFFDPAFGSFFSWTEDPDYGGDDIDAACENIDMENYSIVQLSRVIQLSDVFVVAIPMKQDDDTDMLMLEVYDTEEEADARATAHEAGEAAAE